MVNNIKDTFWGFERPDGSYGIRNYVAVIPSVSCANHVAGKISENVKLTKALLHGCGCAQVGEDKKQTFRTLKGLGDNPNVFGVLVVGLGCETISASSLADAISRTNKPVYNIDIQDEGGTLKAIEKGSKIVQRLVEMARNAKRKRVDVSELVVGTECGGSDWTSGIIANPTVGLAMDKIVAKGGTVILSETTEMIGAEHILVERAVNQKVREKLLEIIYRYENQIIQMGEDIRGSQPTPGNIEGGITTLEEKSLGAVYKGGTSRVVDVIAYGEKVKKKGLVIMDTPGYDVESVTGMVAGGAQIVVFTTGRGSPTGNPIAPVIKVTGNLETFYNMQENIDINAGEVLRGKSLDEIAEEIFREIIAVSSGKLTKAEILGHEEMSIWRVGWSL